MIDTFSIRCSILRLAFSGKLTQQCMSDGNARSILSRISPKKSVEQTENTPYEIPDTWAWVKLADLYTINPKVDAGDAKDAAFIPMERVGAGFNRTFSFERQSWVQASKNHTKFSDGDVAFAKISPCFENRKSFIAQGLPNGIGGGTTELIVLRQGEMLPEYTYYLVLDQRFIATGKASYKGTVGQQRVQPDVIKNFFVPVPPYPEQKRIVARIEQAFAALDTIDAFQAKYADNLAVLKSKLIDAAIRGKLTDQLPEDGTAEELYRQIQTEKQALVRAGKIKKEKPLPEITADEIPFEIPTNWKWVRLECFGSWHSGATPSRGNSSYYQNGTIPWLKTGDLNDDYISFVPESITELALEECSVRINPIGSVLIAMYGATIGKLGIAQIPLTTNQACCACNPYNGIYNRFLFFLLMAMRKTFIDMGIGGAQSNISKEKIVNAVVPLPPFAEQRRIVAKLEELLPLCDQSGNFQ